MRPEDFEQLELLAGTLDAQFGAPTEPERAIQRVMISVAALSPLNQLTTQQGAGELLPVIQEWFTPMVASAIEEAVRTLADLYEALESAADDVQLMEPGTIGNQQFRGLFGGGGGRGELIR